MGYTSNRTPRSNSSVTEEILKDRVKYRMDEVDEAASSLVDVGVINNRPISDIIGTLLNESLLDVLSNAPLNQIPKSKKTYASGATGLTVNENTESVSIVLPDDVMRICSVKYDNWTKYVTAISVVESGIMSRQNYEYLKAKNNTPAVVSVDGTTIIAFPYTKSGNSDTYESIEVIYVSDVTGYGEFNNKMLDAICWNCAGKTFTAMGQLDNASKCFEVYNALIK